MGRQQIKLNKKKRSRKRIFWFLVFPILLIASLGISYGIHLYIKAENMMAESYHDDRAGKSVLREKKVDPKIDNVSILFIGIDDSEKRSQGDHTRSDALLLATLNEKEKSVKLLSIPRDSYVYIDEVGYSTKINHAHAYGGPKATIETVEQLLDIPVDYYVRVDFEAFMEIIDALGGVDIDVPFAFSEQNSKDKADAISLEPGLQTLNGEEALAFARTRKRDNDIERGKRQQEIMKAIVKKAASGTSVVKYGQVIDAIGANMKTDMTFDEIKSFIDYGVASHLTIDTMTLEGFDSYIPNSSGKNVYYWQLDENALAETKTTLKQHLDITTIPATNSVANPSNNSQEGDKE
ncbi:LCP family protein [Lederbergia wuyishanensis]|uniref:LCP family protein required for cell wall assembly n=1 Tax=Lederbergia wuyishanensis TaxID=1347903 RepID=A0ABU0D3B0_9BACI|nr:LCP family protein [Lederbergia wuyishanensis]MCJ8007964.1 LCP family protein [Lederbergia wuyishanensis]MDQ0342866.1 LCP family protein required for cell wall assembly [Lederbergia wuyishanensis]